MAKAPRLLMLAILTFPAGPAAAQTLPWMPPCMAEFAKLREEVQKKGLAVRAAGEKKVAREEMCKHITAYSAAELKWVKYSETNATSCGIPAEVVQQLKQVHNNADQIKGNVCAGVLRYRLGDRDLFPDRPSKRDFLPLGDWGFRGDLHGR